jgi:homoserine kinase
MSNSIRVFSPATIANFGSGFDLLGLAIHGPGDEVEIVPNDENKIIVKSITGDEGRLPYEVTKNTCTVAMQSFLTAYNSNQGFDVYIDKKMPFGSGLGSSAASAAAGVFALNEYFDCPFSKPELIKFALDGEFIASKGYHADNIAPCLLGGITFINDGVNNSIQSISCPNNMHLTVAYQDIEILTAQAREILPQTYSRTTIIAQQAAFGSLLIGLTNSNYDLIATGLADQLAVPFRKSLIENYEELESIAIENNAVGFSISGSGPTVFCVCNNVDTANKIEAAWQTFLSTKSRKYLCFSSKVNNEGTIRIKSER